MICFIFFRSVLGVLLNNRCVLLKKNIRIGLFGLLIFGSFLKSLDNSYSRNIV